jgi:hypothetical protein
MRHIEAELNDAVDDDELTELMDEYGRIQHRFEALGGYGMESEARRSSPGSDSPTATWNATSAPSAAAG